MTQMQKSQYEKALAKATIDNCQIAGKGTIKATGQTFYAVTSSSHDGCYTVIVAGHSLMCNCAAGRNGQYCKHRAIVRSTMEQAAAKVQPDRTTETFRNAPAMSIYR